MKCVLVTGANGFVGRQLVSVLAQAGWNVHAVDMTPPVQPVARVCYHRADLLAHAEVLQLVRRVAPSHLVALAWTTTHGAFWGSPANLDWTGATLQLARAFREHGGQRLVGAGSCAEYDWRAPAPFSESDTPCCPSTLYGVAKLATCRVLESYARSSGLSFSWGRLFFLFGFGESRQRIVASLLTKLLDGAPATCLHSSLVRDFMPVREAARALVALLDSTAEGAVNIASGQAITLGDLARMLGRAAGREDLIQLGNAPAGDQPPEISCLVNRLHAETAFVPAVSLEEAIQQTVFDYRRMHASGKAETA